MLAFLAAPAQRVLKDASSNPTRVMDQIESVVGVPVAATISPRQRKRRAAQLPWEASAGCLQLIQYLQTSAKDAHSLGTVGVMACQTGLNGSSISEQWHRWPAATTDLPRSSSMRIGTSAPWPENLN